MPNTNHHDAISPLIVGGQGTYFNGRYYTEFPDRALALDHMAEVARVVENADYNCVVCSGGFTKKETPDLSEAKSIVNYWTEIQRRPRAEVVLDEVALDSAENVIFGLMSLRKAFPDRPIKRICFYSLWQFKKPRMTSLAECLGIAEQFYFRAFSDERKANAGLKALKGEQNQYERMKLESDFLLRGQYWQKKRFDRFHANARYAERDNEFRELFPDVFTALDSLSMTKISDLEQYFSNSPEMPIEKALKEVRNRKLLELQEAFITNIVKPIRDN